MIDIPMLTPNEREMLAQAGWTHVSVVDAIYTPGRMPDLQIRATHASRGRCIGWWKATSTIADISWTPEGEGA